MHAKHRYILSFLIYFFPTTHKDKNEIKTYKKPRCTQMLDSASHSNNTKVLIIDYANTEKKNFHTSMCRSTLLLVEIVTNNTMSN